MEYLLVSKAIPEFFPEYNRIEAANLWDTNFHQNTSIAVANSECVKSIRAAFNNKPDISGTPFKIKLPFKVEEERIAHWEIRLFDGDAAITDIVGHQQYFSLLKVDLVESWQSHGSCWLTYPLTSAMVAGLGAPDYYGSNFLSPGI